MERDILSAQFIAGLHGLGLLRTWPFLEADAASLRLSELEEVSAVRSHESLDVRDAASGYEAWSPTYDVRMNPLLLAEQPAMRAVIEKIAQGRALDAGCGTGRLTRLLADAGHQVIGVDTSESMLRRAKANIPAATFQRASFLDLPFPDESFDIVCCGLALTHVSELATAIKELARVLIRGGRLLISDVHPVAVATGAHAFFRLENGARAVVRNELHWHGAYLAAFAATGLRVRQCLEPRFSQEVLDAFLSKGSPPALAHLLGLPYALIWDCVL
jgi:ubiquinone/menaquinone biosynthesis C-methylase UbiE